MKKFLVLLLIFILAGCGFKYERNHSEYSQEEIEQRAKVYFNYEFDFQNIENEYYVDNKKLSIDSLKTTLQYFKKKDYKKIDFEKKDCEETETRKNCGITLKIHTKRTKQSEEEKRKILERTINNLNESVSKILIRPDICNECRLVFINFKPYQNREAKKVLNQIQIENIEYIAEYDKPLNPYFFGSMGKAGWIQIWTK
ncbi:hypothetical protein [uncultured Dokdonia sp.]|uniref:hypothetical protein n=1 Tax=uncultured Dokdonia sp. TaxID=575653 RepID=UPI00261B8DB5|nr:hypothetical protein [uncultured Dokdonia sp.]